MKCRKLPNGKWECYEEGPRDPVTNKRNAIRKQAIKKSVAQQKVQTALDNLQSGIDQKQANRITFEQLANDWHAVYSLSGVKNSTIRSRRSSIRTLCKYIGPVAVGRITHGVMQNVLVDLDKQGFSRSMLDGAKVTANFVFQHAIKHQLRTDNPARDIVIPKKRLTVEEIERTDINEKYFEEEELEAFLRAAVNQGLPNDMEWFYLMAFTGMRVGEVCALKWTDINFEDKQIRVTKTMDNPTHNMRKYQLTPPKTKKSIRTFDVDEDLLLLLRKHKTKQAKIKLKFRKEIDDYDNSNFVFCRDNGYPFASRFVYNRTVRLCQKAALSKIEGPHILRHTHITMMTAAGVDLDTIMNKVGHEDSKTTKNIYTHVTKKMKKDATEQVHTHYGDLFRLQN
ncbi:site-specific integrase [Planococcus sp. ANT_H30]|uniref:tyrosine-type recombinase/integrase n=1 Tax=Planococcus sp. ANT_H30 TaxID=2597347 RepID=UPI0011EC5BE2|nr:site-specific integrase [Planococcus sp. ANT_H30]KAA0956676.1 site-specific integrase [Planococcus sp. ANT_H30]